MAVSPNASWQAFERVVLEGLKASFAELPGFCMRELEPVMHRSRDSGVDMEASAEVDGQPVHVLVRAKMSGYPRDIRNAAQHLKVAARQYDPSAVPLLAAPALSPSSRELLREEGIAYWDTGGSLYLKLPHALYFVDRPAPKGEERRVRGVYRGRSAQVLHALLLEPDRWWGVRELAAYAEVSPYTVHQVFIFLEEQLWAEKRGTGPGVARRVTEPGYLLDAWAQAHTLRQYTPHRFHVWAQSTDTLIQIVDGALEDAEIEHALTLTTGAALVAPFGTASLPAAVLVPAGVDLSPVIEHAGLRPVDEGETVVLHATRERSPLLFRRRVHDRWVASDVQLYLDLWALPKRGREQAHHLRTVRLRY